MIKYTKLIENNELLINDTHYTVGAYIHNNNNEILMIDRKNKPYGWACVAGHVDEGETPEEALVREVKEESGLDLIEYKLLFEELLDNECKRGAKKHYWYVYDCKSSGSLKFNDKETNAIGWINIDRIKELKLEPVWNYWFKKLNII